MSGSGGSADGADEEGHVIVLRGAGGEFVGSFDDAVEELLGRDGAFWLCKELVGAGDHAIFSPFLVFIVHGFEDPVSVSEEDVSLVHEDGGLFVLGVWKKADYDFRGFEWDGLLIPEDIRGVVAGVDVGEEAGEGIVFGIEEGGVTVRC